MSGSTAEDRSFKLSAEQIAHERDLQGEGEDCGRLVPFSGAVLRPRRALCKKEKKGARRSSSERSTLYTLDVQRNLFVHRSLVRKRGRIGRAETVRIETPPNAFKAIWLWR
jgi:hypothetical protein